MPKNTSSSSQGLDKPTYWPLVSVVTPSYNGMPYLKETVESVRSQNYPSIEHIVIDGHSDDGTLVYLEQQPNIRWVSEPDRGQSEALNKGFRMANGEIIGWLNADDTYEPGAVSIAVSYLIDNEDVDLVYSDLTIVDQSGRKIGVTRAAPFNLATLILSNYIKQPTVFMRRRVLDDLGGVDESLSYTMDQELWLRAGLADFKMHYLEGCFLSNFRMIPGTKSYDQTPKFRGEWLRVLERAFQNSSLAQLSQRNRRQALRKTRAHFHLAKMIKAAERPNRIKLVRHLMKAISMDWTLVTNRGTWFYVGNGLLGIHVNRLRKYQK